MLKQKLFEVNWTESETIYYHHNAEITIAVKDSDTPQDIENKLMGVIQDKKYYNESYDTTYSGENSNEYRYDFGDFTELDVPSNFKELVENETRLLALESEASRIRSKIEMLKKS